MPPNTSVIDIAFAAGTPEKALEGSHAFAEAYIQVRTDAAAADIAVQNEGLTNQVTASQKQLAVLTRAHRDACSRPAPSTRTRSSSRSCSRPTSRRSRRASAARLGRRHRRRDHQRRDPADHAEQAGPAAVRRHGHLRRPACFGLALAVLAARTDRGSATPRTSSSASAARSSPSITKPARGKPHGGVLSARTGSGEFDRLRLRLDSATLDRVDSVLVCARRPRQRRRRSSPATWRPRMARSGQDVVLVCADPDSATAALFGHQRLARA